MSFKENLDKIKDLIMKVRFSDLPKDQVAKQIEDILILMGQLHVREETLKDELQKYMTHIWISHIKGELECPVCKNNLPLDFYVGSKGVNGKSMSSGTHQGLINKLSSQLTDFEIPDYLPPDL